MDVAPWCSKVIGWDGPLVGVRYRAQNAARNHLWKIHLHLICLVPFCAQVEMDPILARISLFLSSPSGVQKCPKVSKYLSTQTGHLTPPPPQVLSLSGLPCCLPWVVSNTLFCFYQLLQFSVSSFYPFHPGIQEPEHLLHSLWYRTNTIWSSLRFKKCQTAPVIASRLH